MFCSNGLEAAKWHLTLGIMDILLASSEMVNDLYIFFFFLFIFLSIKNMEF